MYKILMVGILLQLRDILKNRGVTSIIKYYVYKSALQRTGCAFSRYFLYIHLLKKG
jgi:hypothetical protein